MSWFKWFSSNKVEPEVIIKEVQVPLEECPTEGVCAYEYKGRLYRTQEEIVIAKKREVEAEVESRLYELKRRWVDVFERRYMYHLYGRPTTTTHHEAIDFMIENHKWVGEEIRKAKGIPKLEKISDSEYRVVGE
jgi:hypothetical protein